MKHLPNPPSLSRVKLIVLLAMLLPACTSGPRQTSGRHYPLTMPQSRMEDVQVIRDETRITLTNTSARAFEAGTMWINRQYSRPTDRIAVGRTVTFALAEFRNEHGEPFRAGGFFATEKPDIIAQVQLEEEDRMTGFVMVGAR